MYDYSPRKYRLLWNGQTLWEPERSPDVVVVPSIPEGAAWLRFLRSAADNRGSVIMFGRVLSAEEIQSLYAEVIGYIEMNDEVRKSS